MKFTRIVKKGTMHLFLKFKFILKNFERIIQSLDIFGSVKSRSYCIIKPFVFWLESQKFTTI